MSTHSTRTLPTFSQDSAANSQWALDELGSIQLGDSRSNRRVVSVFSQMFNAPG